MSFPYKLTSSHQMFSDEIKSHILNMAAKCNSISSVVKPKSIFRLQGFEKYLPQIQKSVQLIINKYGIRHYRSRFSSPGTPRGVCKYYSGLSLTFDPDNKNEVDPHQSAFGKPRYGLDNIFLSPSGDQIDGGLELYNQLMQKNIACEAWHILEYEGPKKFKSFLENQNVNLENIKIDTNSSDYKKNRILKGNFSDTFAFRHLTPAANEGALGGFLKKFKRSFTRSRLAIIDSNYLDDEFVKQFSWHRDDNLCMGIRVNIPLFTNENFKLEIEGGETKHLDTGHAYSWDTSKQHRVYAEKKSVGQRVHLVLALSPWLDYDCINDCWVTNEFFGEKHPFDMLNDGDIFDDTTIFPADIL